MDYIVFEWQKNWTKQHHALWPKNMIKISASMGARRNISRGQRRNFAYPFQIADEAMQTFTKRFAFSTSLVCASWISSLIFCLKCFYTSAIRNAFSFHKLPNVHFFEHYLQISHNLKTINRQNSMSGEKTRKLHTIAKRFQAMRSRGGSRRGDAPPPETYKSNFIRHDFVQFGKQYSRIKAILSSIVFSQQCCSVYCIFLTVAKPLCDLTTTYYWNRPHHQPYCLDPPMMRSRTIWWQDSGTTYWS